MSKPKHHHGHIPRFHSKGDKGRRGRDVQNYNVPALETVPRVLDRRREPTYSAQVVCSTQKLDSIRGTCPCGLVSDRKVMTLTSAKMQAYSWRVGCWP